MMDNNSSTETSSKNTEPLFENDGDVIAYLKCLHNTKEKRDKEILDKLREPFEVMKEKLSRKRKHESEIISALEYSSNMMEKLNEKSKRRKIRVNSLEAHLRYLNERNQTLLRDLNVSCMKKEQLSSKVSELVKDIIKLESTIADSEEKTKKMEDKLKKTTEEKEHAERMNVLNKQRGLVVHDTDVHNYCGGDSWSNQVCKKAFRERVHKSCLFLITLLEIGYGKPVMYDHHWGKEAEHAASTIFCLHQLNNYIEKNMPSDYMLQMKEYYRIAMAITKSSLEQKIRLSTDKTSCARLHMFLKREWRKVEAQYLAIACRLTVVYEHDPYEGPWLIDKETARLFLRTHFPQLIPSCEKNV